MGLFKNEVGRPSNETLEKRRKVYTLIVIVIVIVLLIGVGVFYTVNYFKSNSDVSGKSKNVLSAKKGDVTSVLNCNKRDNKLTVADLDALSRYLVGDKLPGFNLKYADVDGNGKIDKNDWLFIYNELYSANKDTKIKKRISSGYGNVCGDYSTSTDGKVTQDDLNLIFANIVFGYNKALTNNNLNNSKNKNRFRNADFDGNNYLNIDDMKKLYYNSHLFKLSKSVSGSNLKTSSVINRYYYNKNTNAKISFGLSNAKGYVLYDSNKGFRLINNNNYTYSTSIKVANSWASSVKYYYYILTPLEYYHELLTKKVTGGYYLGGFSFQYSSNTSKIKYTSKPSISSTSTKKITFSKTEKGTMYYSLMPIALTSMTWFENDFPSNYGWIKINNIGTTSFEIRTIKYTSSSAKSLMLEKNNKYVFNTALDRMLVLQVKDDKGYYFEDILYVPPFYAKK